MIAVDTNILVYALRKDATQHAAALSALTGLADGPVRWAIPDQVIGEFLRVVTDPRAPVDLGLVRAVAWMDALLASSSVEILGSGPRHWQILKDVVIGADARGTDVHDARLVALCLEHGVDRVLSEDRNLRRFDDITVIGLGDYGTVRERAPRYRATRRRVPTAR